MEMKQSGHIPMLVWHDESDIFDCSGAIPGISVINSLSKTFPSCGRYAGDMILRLYRGVGDGIPFTKSQVKKLMGGNTFKGAVRMYESPETSLCGSQLASKQRRESLIAKRTQLENKKKKRKLEIQRSESFNTAKLKRVAGTKALVADRRKSGPKNKRKLNFTEASRLVIEHAKSPSIARKRPDHAADDESVEVCEDMLHLCLNKLMFVLVLTMCTHAG